MTTTKTSKKLGSRVTVEFAAAKSSGKKGVKSSGARYIYVLKSTAEALGLKTVAAAGVKTKKGNTIAVRGAVGSGSIKVPVGDSKNGKKQYKRIPVPGNATINEIRQFLSKASKKPESFVTVNGRTYPIVSGK
jgi:hypothetical protein